LPCPPSTVAAYRRIDHALRATFRRGETDGQAAFAAGIRFVWMDRGRGVEGQRLRRRVRNLGELVDLL